MTLRINIKRNAFLFFCGLLFFSTVLPIHAQQSPQQERKIIDEVPKIEKQASAVDSADKAQDSDDDDPPLRQILWDGAVRMAMQPKGYTNLRASVSPDGRLAAFLSTKNRSDCIVVVDQKTGNETVVPAPDEKIFERRSIRGFAWGQDSQTLYMIEHATTGMRTITELHSLEIEERIRHIDDNIYGVLYTWNLGKTHTQIIDRIDCSRIFTMAVYNEKICVLGETKIKNKKENEWAYVDVVSYQNNKRISSQTIHITYQDKSIDHFDPQIILQKDELWFITQFNNFEERWLAKINLKNIQAQTQLVLRDVGAFLWSSDGQILIVLKFHTLDHEKNSQAEMYKVRRDTLDKPEFVTAKEVRPYDDGLQIAGISPDHQFLYFQGLSKATATLREAIFNDGITQLYEIKLPK